MRKIFNLILGLLLFAGCGIAQTYPTPGPGGRAHASSTTIYGQNSFTSGAQENDNNNYIAGIYFVPSVNETAVSCSVMLAASTNASGSKIDCGIYSGTATQFTTPLCHTTYTAPSANLAAQTVTVSLSGCGTLTAGTPYWVVENNNDSGFSNQEFTCGSTCSGTAGTSTYPDYYIAQTYGTYGSSLNPTRDTVRISVFLTATP